MNRNTVIVDGTKPGSASLLEQEGRPELRARWPSRTSGAQRHHGLEGQQRLGPEPDRVQLPQRRRRRRQRDLVERWRQGQDRRPGAARLVPDDHEHVLQGRADRRGRTGSSRAPGPAARATRSTLRTSTTRATTSAPAVRCATRRSTTPGRSSTRSATRDRTRAVACWSRTRSSTTTRTGSTPTARTATTRRRRTAPARPASSRRSRAPRPAGCSSTTSSTTTTTPTSRRAGSAAAGPVGTGMSVSGGRNDTVMNNRFVNNNAWGMILVAYPDSGPPCTGGTKDSPILGKGSCLYDEWGDHVINNTFSAQRRLRKPDQRRLRAAQLRDAPERLLQRQRRHVRRAESRTRPRCRQAHPTCTTTPVASEHNIPFLNEVAVRLAGPSCQPFGCQPGDHYPQPFTHSRHAQAAQAPGDDAQPVQGRAGQPVV